MDERGKVHRCPHVGRGVLWIVSMVAIGGLLILWSWNSVVAGVFGLSRLEWTQAVALEVLLTALYFPLVAVRLLIAESDQGRKGASP